MLAETDSMNARPMRCRIARHCDRIGAGRINAISQEHNRVQRYSARRLRDLLYCRRKARVIIARGQSAEFIRLNLTRVISKCKQSHVSDRGELFEQPTLAEHFALS